MSNVTTLMKSTLRKAIGVVKPEVNIIPGELNLTELPALLGRSDPTILEVGCNDGTHTLRFLKLFENPRVYAFEPDPRARERFERKVKDARVTLCAVAISDRDGTARFHTSGGTPPPDWETESAQGKWDESGSIKKPKRHLDAYPWCTFDNQIEVETKRLDTWCDEEGVTSIDFLWVDVQGAEADLIRGGAKALKNTRYLYTEYSDEEMYEGQSDLDGLLKLLPDFRVVRRYERDILLKNRRCG